MNVHEYGAKHWIYEIECIPTAQVYVGQTIKSPMSRWSEHMSALMNNNSISPLFQKAWDEHPDITQWRFRILGHAVGKVNANHVEAKLILDSPKPLRLNSEKTSTLSLEKRLVVEQMLQDGIRYVDINAHTGVSMGMISKIKKALDGIYKTLDGVYR